MKDTYDMTWTKLGRKGFEEFKLENTGPLYPGVHGDPEIYCADESDLHLINNAPGLLIAAKRLIKAVDRRFCEVYEADVIALKEEVRKAQGETP